MIPLDRGAEHPKLPEIREQRLQKAIKAFNTHGPASLALGDTLGGYDIVKRLLFERQHKKCAYCERKPGFLGQPVEHFRPKKLAIRGSDEDVERYWWLTWTWENLLFACTTCNGPANKGNHFPLASGSSPLACPVHPAALPLPPSCFQVSSEQPLLLDPADTASHPLDHLRWLPVDRTLARSLWAWQLRGLTARGHTTKKRLGLDALADDVDGRYRDTVWPRFHDEIERKLAIKQTAQLHATWDKLVRDLIKPTSALTAATWSMLDVLRTSTAALGQAHLPAPPRP